MKTPFLFIGQRMSAITHQWLYNQQVEYVEVNTETPVEKFENEVFDAFLFFSPAGIESYRASGNFPPPSSLIIANGNPTAQAAWRYFTNKVVLLAEQDELSFVQYSIAHWMKENSK
ncbi:MAG: hypothetical protein JZU47_16260 [Prolixibacteraceae bacterium]|nr:hypothetical protein [Prolixibacteraceae bacterium]